MKLAHIALSTIDPEEAARLWRDCFEARIGQRTESRNRPGTAARFAPLPGRDLQIELMEGPWVGALSGEARGRAHVAVSVGSVAEVDRIAKTVRHGRIARPRPALDRRRLRRSCCAPPEWSLERERRGAAPRATTT